MGLRVRVRVGVGVMGRGRVGVGVGRRRRVARRVERRSRHVLSRKLVHREAGTEAAEVVGAVAEVGAAKGDQRIALCRSGERRGRGGVDHAVDHEGGGRTDGVLGVEAHLVRVGVGLGSGVRVSVGGG